MEDIYKTTRPITSRQKMAVNYWIADGRKSKADAMKKAGYSPAMCRQPQKVFNSPIVKNELYLLGYGYDGKSLKSKPKGFDISPKKTEPKYYDISASLRKLTLEQRQDLKEKIYSTPPSPALLRKMKRRREEQNTSRPIKNDPNCDIFGERLPNRPETQEELEMSDLSSI